MCSVRAVPQTKQKPRTLDYDYNKNRDQGNRETSRVSVLWAPERTVIALECIKVYKMGDQ